MSSAHRVMPSGIPPLDARLRGVVAGRLHMLSGGPGTGKSTACLQFIGHGLRLGESAAMLTAERMVDLRSHAAYLGIDLDGPLRDGRLVLLRYRSGFSTLLQHTASPELMLDDLRRMIHPIQPARLVVDTVSPLLASASHSDTTVEALAELLEEMDAATLLTYSGDVTGGRGAGCDDRLQPLVERAAAIVHLTRQIDGRSTLYDLSASREPSYRLHLVRARQPVLSAAPASYAIEAGVGLVLVEHTSGDGDTTATRRRLLAVAAGDVPSEEILAVPRLDFVVDSHEVAAGAPIPDPKAEGAAAILVEMRHESMNAALALIRDLSRHPHAVPVLGVTRFRLRSADRARALRAGADDVLACDTGPAELLERLHASVRRGRGQLLGDARSAPRDEETLLTQPTEPAADASSGMRYRPLDRYGFAHALAAHVAHDHPTQYTVVSLAPPGPRIAAHADAGGSSEHPVPEPPLHVLAALAMRLMRVAGGDLAAILDGRVAVYLHGARLGDASSFIERVREQWTVQHRTMLRVESLAYPFDEPLRRALMKVDEPDPARDGGADVATGGALSQSGCPR